MKKKIIIAALIVIVTILSIAIYIGRAPWEPHWLCGPGHFFKGRTAIIVDTIFWGILISWSYLLIRMSKSIDKTLAATNTKRKD